MRKGKSTVGKRHNKEITKVGRRRKQKTTTEGEGKGRYDNEVK